MVAGGIAANQKDDVGMFHVLELHGAGAGADHAGKPHAAGLMAVKAAVVDVVGAVEPGKELQQKARLVARAAAEIPERLIGLRRLELGGDPSHRVGPFDRPVVLRALLQHNRLHESAGMLHLMGREGAQLRHRIGGEELRLHSPLHVGHHRLERFFAHLGEVARLVHHAARLPTHSHSAGLAGVLGTHRLPEGPQSPHLAGFLQRVEHSPPTAA